MRRSRIARSTWVLVDCGGSGAVAPSVETVLGDLGETAYWVGEVSKGRRRVIYE